MNEVKIIEDDSNFDRPYMVKVNGTLLLNSQSAPRRFSTSFKAAVAGSKEVDRMRSTIKTTEKLT